MPKKTALQRNCQQLIEIPCRKFKKDKKKGGEPTHIQPPPILTDVIYPPPPVNVGKIKILCFTPVSEGTKCRKSIPAADRDKSILYQNYQESVFLIAYVNCLENFLLMKTKQCQDLEKQTVPESAYLSSKLPTGLSDFLKTAQDSSWQSMALTTRCCRLTL